MLTEAIFYQPKPFFLDWANKESGKICIRYSLLFGSLKLFFATTHYYRRFDICRRTRDESYRYEIIVLRGAGTWGITLDHQGISWGQPDGLCR